MRLRGGGEFRTGVLIRGAPVRLHRGGRPTNEVEIRPVFETEDFGAEMTPELRAREERLRAELEGKGAS